MKLLKDEQGSAIIWAPVLLLVLMTFFTSLFEYSRLNTVAANTNDAVQAALTQVCTDNTSQVYSGVREGYSGGYKLESINWTPNVSPSDILSKVDAKLGTSNGVKMSDSKLVYQISDLSVDLKNAPLAPSDPDGTEQLTGTATYTLTVSLSFGWSALPPMTIHMEAKSGYSQQGDLSGESNSGDGTGTQVTDVSLSESALTLRKGDTDVLEAGVVPENAEDRSVSWASTDSSICSVTQTGVVTGVNIGETSVLAVSDSGKMARCEVTVVNPVTGVSLNKSQLSMTKGMVEDLIATVSPSDATNKSVNWISSDPSVCTVSSTGKVTAVGTGQSTITVMTQEGGYYAECVVKVTIPVTGITLDRYSLALPPGGTNQLTATVWPEDASDKTVFWASSDDSICTVDQSGNVTGIGAGSAVITATTKDGQYVAQCDVHVGVPVTGITIDPATLTLPKGTSKALNATVVPDNATDKAVSWFSSDPSVVTVDDTGMVTAVDLGTATITVKTNDGEYTAACDVTVVIPVTGVSLSQSSLSVVKGNTAQLTATVIPTNAADKAVTWSTSNTSVASVDQSGNVTAVDGGTATITVRTHDGGYTASCKVTVFVPVTGISVSPISLTMRTGDTAQLTATITPKNATDKSVTWSSSNTSVCTVDSSGKVKAVGAGSSMITVKAQNGGVKATCSVSVKSSSSVAMWTFSKEISGLNGKQQKWNKKDIYENSLDFSIAFDLYSHGSHDKVDGIYTFTNPFVLEQGGKITIYTQHGANDDDELFINGDMHNLYRKYWKNLYDNGALTIVLQCVIDVPDGTEINSITYRHPWYSDSSHRNKTLYKIYISPNGAPTFMLNSSGTSNNQDVDLDDLKFPFDYDWS